MSVMPDTVPDAWTPAEFPRVSVSNGVVFRDLDLTDRCDRCGAAAKAQVIVNADSDPLLFCGHDFRARKDAFDAAGMTYSVDEEHAEVFTWGSKPLSNKARDAGSV